MSIIFKLISNYPVARGYYQLEINRVENHYFHSKNR